MQKINSWFKKFRFILRPYLVRPSKRSLPDFIIIGAQKSGTSSLSYNLGNHPDIYIANANGYGNGELHFFDREKYWNRGSDWYKGHFPNSTMVQGEKTPRYLFADKCHQRMYRLVPNAQLIILLRNPVNRAYSQWNHYNQSIEQGINIWHWQHCSFEECIRTKTEVLNRGKYINQIMNILMFYPKKQIYIGIAEKFQSDPQREFNNILSFLGVTEKPIHLRNRHVRSYPEPMQEETRAFLQKIYRPLNEELFDFLGYEVEEWNT